MAEARTIFLRRPRERTCDHLRRAYMVDSRSPRKFRSKNLSLGDFAMLFGDPGSAVEGADSAASVAVVDAPSGGYVNQLDIEEKVIGSTASVRGYLISRDNHEELFGIREPYLILWHHVSLDAEFFERNPHCRAVVCASVGYNHVDIDAARRHGVAIYHVPQYGTEEVADHTLALFLSAARRLPELAEHVRDGGWDWRRAMGVHRLRGANWGIVGLGRIGLAVAVRAKAFGMRVSFHDPYNHPGIDKSMDLVRKSTLDELLADSDVVSLHVPLDERTYHLIGARELGLMRQGAYLVNTARGALVDAGALETALAEDRPCFVALDVVDNEPALPAWLRKHPRALLSPHSAFYSFESLVELRTRAATAARELVSGSPVTAAVGVVPRT
ncbi:MAG: C-terminal binding protein [Sciscionella sp.]